MAMGLERVPNGFTALGNNNNKEKKSSGEPGRGSSRALEKKTHTSRPWSDPTVYGIISVQPPTLLKPVRPTLSLLSSRGVVEYGSRFLPFMEPGCQTHLPAPLFFPNSATSLRG